MADQKFTTSPPAVWDKVEHILRWIVKTYVIKNDQRLAYRDQIIKPKRLLGNKAEILLTMMQDATQQYTEYEDICDIMKEFESDATSKDYEIKEKTRCFALRTTLPPAWLLIFDRLYPHTPVTIQTFTTAIDALYKEVQYSAERDQQLQHQRNLFGSSTQVHQPTVEQKSFDEALGLPADPTLTGHEDAAMANYMGQQRGRGGRRTSNNGYNRNSDNGNKYNQYKQNTNNNMTPTAPTQNIEKYFRNMHCGYSDNYYFCGQYGHMRKDHHIVSQNQFAIARELQKRVPPNVKPRIFQNEYDRLYPNTRGNRGGRGRDRGGGHVGHGYRPRGKYIPRGGRYRGDRGGYRGGGRRGGGYRGNRGGYRGNPNRDKRRPNKTDRIVALIHESKSLNLANEFKSGNIDATKLSPKQAKQTLIHIGQDAKWKGMPKPKKTGE